MKNSTNNQSAPSIKLKPHHLLCVLCFQGKGYNEEFVQNLGEIYNYLHSAPEESRIEIAFGLDDICDMCPNNLGLKCRQEEKVAALDAAYTKVLHLQPEEVLSLNAIKNRIKKFLSLKDFHKICSQCSWYKNNLCVPIIESIIKA